MTAFGGHGPTELLEQAESEGHEVDLVCFDGQLSLFLV